MLALAAWCSGRWGGGGAAVWCLGCGVVLLRCDGLCVRRDVRASRRPLCGSGVSYTFMTDTCPRMTPALVGCHFVCLLAVALSVASCLLCPPVSSSSSFRVSALGPGGQGRTRGNVISSWAERVTTCWGRHQVWCHGGTSSLFLLMFSQCVLPGPWSAAYELISGRHRSGGHVLET